MLIADLYIRVSTDEQADKGYSQRDQDERLRRYCEINGMQIRKVIFEDYSAKTFERPEWRKLLFDLKQTKNKSNLILFTKWDRFSRNTGDAYQMIMILRKLGVEPQAIEQPLDLSIPENKIMLAFYLSAPEVENDRRALNTFNGMRRAKKEGRWMATAPIGYVNKIKENGTKYIAVNEEIAVHIRWLFEELAKNRFNTAQVLKMAQKRGLKCNKSYIWSVIRNPVYCGKIVVPEYRDEPKTIVSGVHETIISEELFYAVQDILDGRHRSPYRPKSEIDSNFPLREYLICPRCGRFLTGSKSKGRSRYYSYYHCSTNSCGIRFRTDQTNDLFLKELRKYMPKSGMPQLYLEILTNEFELATMDINSEHNKLVKQISEFTERLNKARVDKLFGRIDAEDFSIMKSIAEKEIKELEKKLDILPRHVKSIEGMLQKGLETLMKLDDIFEHGTIIERRKLVGSMFPDNLTFNGELFRTARVNTVASCIYLIDNELEGIKKGQVLSIFDLPSRVSSQYFEPVNGLPYIGNMPGQPGNILVATGFDGNGMTYSSVAALVLKSMVLEEEGKYEKLFDPNRLKPVAGFSNFIKENFDVVKKFVGKLTDKEKLEELAGLAPGEGKLVKYEDRSIAIYKDDHGNIHALNPVCTHMKCDVAWNTTERSWDCPCHGARYDIDGKVLTGPADRDLDKIHIVE